MPQVTGAVALDLEALAQLTYYRLHQTTRAGCPADEATRVACFQVAAQQCVQINVRPARSSLRIGRMPPIRSETGMYQYLKTANASPVCSKDDFRL